jgi:hypothetical protein
MAQAKTKASAKRSGGSTKSGARSRGSSTKSSTKSSKSSNSRKATSSRKSNSSRKSKSKSNGSRKATASPMSSAAEKASSAASNAAGKASDAAGKATSAVGTAADKAKIPLVASGAALAGAAGGLMLGSRHSRRGKGLAKVMPRRPRRPQVKVKSSDLAKAAKEVGSFGAQLGQLANELQRAREGSNGKHRSPVEVVLEGLTARRSRS